MNLRRAAPLLGALLGACGAPEACPEGSQSVCLALRLTGDTGPLDQLQVTLSTGDWAYEARPALPGGPAPPLLLPLLLARPPTGAVDVVVTGLRGAQPRGFGRLQVSLPRAGRTSAELALDPASACVDSARGGAETDVDCGGSCDRCDNARACGGDDDCRSGLCDSGRCVIPTPQITAVDPPYGKVSGGGLVKVSGSGFPKRTPLLVRFNGVHATELERVSATLLQVRAPASAQPMRVGVNLVINNRVVTQLLEAYQYQHLLLSAPVPTGEPPGMGDPSPVALVTTTGLIALLRKNVLTTYPVDARGVIGPAKAEGLGPLDPKGPELAAMSYRNNDITRPLMAVIQSGGSVSVFARDGAGAAWYQRGVHLGAAERLSGLAMVDVDADGRVDVLASGARGLYYLRASNELGDFESRRIYEVPSANTTDATALAVLPRGPSSAVLFLGLLDTNKKAGLLQTLPGFSLTPPPVLSATAAAELRSPVTALQLNLARGRRVLYGATAGGVLVAPLTPAAQLDQAALVGPERAVSSLAVDDLDGDGYPDLAVVSESGLALRPGDAELKYDRQQPEGGAGRPVQVLFADLNGDGRPELLVANQDPLRQLLVYSGL